MRARTKLVDLDWLESNFPCMQACSVHTQAGRYVSLIAEGQYEEAYRYARSPNPLASICGRVCGHPCETACRRGQFDAPISIRALKRFVTERFVPESRNPVDVFINKPKVTHEEKVAVIGSGPAGLAAAHDLALLGYPVTIFEASPVPGGMLHLGIPEYRLPRDVIQAQVREILDLGPELRLNSRLGDFSLADLRAEGFKAILLAIGLHRSRDLILPGRDLDGVITGGPRDDGVLLRHDDLHVLLRSERRVGPRHMDGVQARVEEHVALGRPDERGPHRRRRELGSLAAALGGLDALVFTAGIGEHAAPVRARVGREAAWLGLELDEAANGAGGPRISCAASRVSAWVIPTDEELMIARHTARVALQSS